MNRKLAFQMIALTNFILLVILFLFFRQGFLDKYIYNNSQSKLTSPNGGTPIKSAGDTTLKKKDTLKRQHFSSSKSLVIIDDFKIKSDTTKQKKDSTGIKLEEDEKQFMYSSKSGIIIDPKILLPDSLKPNKKKQKKKDPK